MLENYVREFREKRKLTQIELAEAVEVSRQTIHSIEKMKVVPTVEIAMRLATAMNTKVEKLFYLSKTRIRP